MFLKRTIKYLCFLIMVYSPYTFATDIDYQTQYWVHFEVKGKFDFNPKYLYMFEEKFIFSNESPSLSEQSLRGGIGHQLKSNLRFWAGYVWKREWNDTASDHLDISNAIWEQLTWTIIDRDDFHFKTRLRTAQGKENSNSELIFRLRQKFSVQFPNKLFNKYTPEISEEIFFNLTNPNWLSKTTFDQNRVFIGVRIPLKHKLTLKVGYLNVYKSRSPKNVFINAPLIKLNANIN